MTGSVKDNTAHHHNNTLHILLRNNSPSAYGVTGVNEICKLCHLKRVSHLMDLWARDHYTLEYGGTF